MWALHKNDRLTMESTSDDELVISVSQKKGKEENRVLSYSEK